MSRREFLKRAGAAGTAAAVAGPLAFARQARAAAAPRIAIVGGGIAGLAAALTLQDNGVHADVYESSGRVGGRMHSDWQEFGHSFWANGQQAELCGEMIDTNHKTILQLARRFNLATVNLIMAQPNATTGHVLDLRRSVPVRAGEQRLPARPRHSPVAGSRGRVSHAVEQLQPGGSALDRLSLYDWIDRFVPGGHGSNFGRLLDSAYNEEYGADTTDQSSLNLVFLLGFKAKPGNFRSSAPRTSASTSRAETQLPETMGSPRRPGCRSRRALG